ncbi:hypothetical protein Q428_11230 [Fervidicella metallireducens AeB]|uniref:Uncharacterized protein n=1 Tax=Fervidicella metallireducens AeB TaxID=1403537 RepID=A0A017RV94_9CLOT|nr:hypothetical protein Q428_11230 [Fervidicella metallireducens AeB]
MNLSERYEVNRVFYLTSGNFEEKIFRNHRNLWMFTSFKMELLDCFHIVKKFLGFKRSWISLNDNNDNFDIFSP